MEKTLRYLARSSKYQFLYRLTKESNISLFNNKDLTDLQILFLEWLEVYYVLNTDIIKKEQYITSEVVNDDLRTDAYILYKQKNKSVNDNKSQIDTNSTLPTVLFKSKVRK